MSTFDQVNKESPRIEIIKQSMRFSLPQLPLRLKNIANPIIGASPSKLGFVHEADTVIQCEAACISPTPPRMKEPHREDMFSNEQETTINNGAPIYEREIMTSESYLSSNNVTQCPIEIAVRPKRQKQSHEQTRFSDIIGHASVKLRIDELILPLGLPSAIADSVLKGIRSIPASIFLYGPPGCGKVRFLFYPDIVLLASALILTFRLYCADKTG
jgi:hypothetical protein